MRTRWKARPLLPKMHYWRRDYILLGNHSFVSSLIAFREMSRDYVKDRLHWRLAAFNHSRSHILRLRNIQLISKSNGYGKI